MRFVIIHRKDVIENNRIEFGCFALPFFVTERSNFDALKIFIYILKTNDRNVELDIKLREKKIRTLKYH